MCMCIEKCLIGTLYLMQIGYWSAACMYSVLGIMEFAYYVRDFDTIPGYQLAYVSVRLAFGLQQIPVHAALLTTLRYSADAAREFKQRLGGGDYDKGNDKYYAMLPKCNFMMASFFACGTALLIKTWEIQPLFYRVVEIMSLSILGLVLLARAICACCGCTRSVFRTAES
ncbi:MAG: hypothetical protein Edafosvirus52_4 [Edafosvirus sp.]|uniref:Uncharacterized protein n=1 Tax=Edafosvirus sp. TaxID=2487765 RepID=A0A3G4ZVQ1_9VIRU|nr:MAG: hypothetical protein Edafosvirus52_4 [Edafosvirus sp.]